MVKFWSPKPTLRVRSPSFLEKFIKYIAKVAKLVDALDLGSN